MGLLWWFFVFILTQNILAKSFHIDFKILSKIVTLLLMSCRRDNEDRRPGAIPSKQTTNVIFFSRIFSMDFWSSANFFIEMVETNIDHHKILDNFHLKCLFRNSTVSWTILRTTKKQKFIFRHSVIPTTTSQRRFENLFLRKDGGGDRDSCIGRPLLEPTHYLSTDVIGYR